MVGPETLHNKEKILSNRRTLDVRPIVADEVRAGLTDSCRFGRIAATSFFDTVLDSLAGIVRADESERAEVTAILLAPDGPVAAAARSADETTLLGAIERWRLRGSDPRAGGLVLETCETMARVYEQALGELDAP